MLTVQVSRWSQAAASLLPPQQAVIGRVHSCYARIINVRTPGERLLTLQGEGMLQAPLGLALATDVVALGTHLPVGALVVQDIPTARSYLAALRLRCADALVWDGHVPAQPGLTPSELAGRAHGLAAWLCLHTPAHGLAPLLLALEHGPRGPLGHQPRKVCCHVRPIGVHSSRPRRTLSRSCKRCNPFPAFPSHSVRGFERGQWY